MPSAASSRRRANRHPPGRVLVGAHAEQHPARVGPGTTPKFPTGEPVAAILADPSGYYVNVHNAEYPGGAIRGQLAPLS